MNLGKRIGLIVSMFLVSTGFSQVNFGIKGGVNTGNLSVDWNSVENTIANNELTGFEIGSFLNIEIGDAYIRPEALYSFQKGNTIDDLSSASFAHRFELPIIAGFKFLGPLAIEAGPTFHYTAYASERLSGDFSIQTSGVGYRIGPSLQLGNLMMYANFQGFINNLGNSPDIKEPYRINAGIGYRFSK